jgi:hypothetical protein
VSSTVDLFERQDLGAFDGDRQRERVEQAHLLRLMTESPGWVLLERLVGAELVNWERRILTGTLDPDVYRHKSGYVLGLRHALDTPGEFQKLVAREQQLGQTEEEAGGRDAG